MKQHSVLDGDGGQLAGADAQEGIAPRRVGIAQYPEGLPLPLRGKQPHVRRVQILFPALRPHHVAEQRAILTPLQPVRARLLLVGPADGQIGQPLQAVVDDRFVAHCGPHHFIAAAVEHFDQPFDLAGFH